MLRADGANSAAGNAAGQDIVGALPARIQVTPDTEVERRGAEGRPDTTVDVDFSGSPVRERDALGRSADVELQVLVHIVARLEIGGDRRVVIGLGDAAEDVVVHDPAPKAISQGSNGAGAGAGGAFSGISAANDEPAVIASTAAAKTSFFMTIPITLKTAQFPTPQGKAITDCDQIPERNGNLVRAVDRGKQKRRVICRLFRRYGASAKCCRRVLYSDNNLGWFRCRLGRFRFPSPEQSDRWPVDGPAKSAALCGA